MRYRMKYNSPNRPILFSLVLRRILTCVVIACIGVPIYRLYEMTIGGKIGIIQQTTCYENMRYLTRALLMYAEDSDGKLPDADRWSDSIGAYEPKVVTDDGRPASSILHCPSAKSKFSYAFNYSLDQRSPDNYGPAGSLILLFEADASGKNAVGNKDFLCSRPRHAVYNFGMADGHVVSSWAAVSPYLEWDVGVARKSLSHGNQHRL